MDFVVFDSLSAVCNIARFQWYEQPTFKVRQKKGEKKEQRPHLLWHNKIVKLSLTIFHEKNTVRNIFQIQPKCIAAEWSSSPFSKIDLVKPKKG